MSDEQSQFVSQAFQGGPIMPALGTAYILYLIPFSAGTVVGVNESTAFSWPVCDRCGNGKLELYPQDSGLLYCNQCSEVVISPVLKMQLEVFLSCPSQSQSTVKVKLLQRTISSLLMSAANEDGSYEASSVLGTELGPLPCLLLADGGRPGCVRLDEVELLPAGPDGAGGCGAAR
ncbi:hypothetical protein ASZ78_003823 [Callipepla squamata]|uniref:DUF4503 domain-containing protein n=1 Tax=Callipepla squamata TaxID=9009 RepID=A0A226MK80_CALSU|nr:hypothetical protein ASZ78_003823 [Callipepla squamata]